MKAITIILLALILVVSGCKPKPEATKPAERNYLGKGRGQSD